MQHHIRLSIYSAPTSYSQLSSLSITNLASTVSNLSSSAAIANLPFSNKVSNRCTALLHCCNFRDGTSTPKRVLASSTWYANLWCCAGGGGAVSSNPGILLQATEKFGESTWVTMGLSSLCRVQPCLVVLLR